MWNCGATTLQPNAFVFRTTDARGLTRRRGRVGTGGTGYSGLEMGSWLDKRRVRMLPSEASSASAISNHDRTAAHETRFVPARWLVLLFGIAWTVLTGGKVAKLGLVGLVWSVTPRPLKIATAGVVVTWAIVCVGALAAIALLVLQIG